MRILAIETSCDETAISIVDARGNPRGKKRISFGVRANLTLSQAKLHAQYGGVFPNLAKREHSKNLIPLFKKALSEAGLLRKVRSAQNNQMDVSLLKHESELREQFLKFVPFIRKPPIDAIAVTYGPGLDPALWVGVNFAKALALYWDIPVIPVNHMEGHLFSAVLKKDEKSQTPRLRPRFANATPGEQGFGGQANYKLQTIRFPAVGLLISGGHTELVLVKKWGKHRIVGETRDDAVGEAFDKVARMLSLPYPGGPAISKLATSYLGRAGKLKDKSFRLPRPMIDSKDLDFSFSGLKTAVLYLVRDLGHLTPQKKGEIAYEFQEAVTEVLVSKTTRAAKQYKTPSILVGGGVSANIRIKEALEKDTHSKIHGTNLYISPISLTGDNALMIAVAGYMTSQLNPKKIIAPRHLNRLTAQGNLRLS